MPRFIENNDLFDNVLQIEQQNKINEASVDFYGMFSVLYGLFDRLGNLNTAERDNTKLNFSFSHPDYTFSDETQNAVVFDIYSRTRVAYDTSAGKIKQEKPRELPDSFDTVTGQVSRVYSYTYDNLVTLDVFSTSCERLYQIVQYLETIFTKYKGYLQKYFTKVIYQGVYSESNKSANLFKNRMFHKQIRLQIVTETPFTLLYEEIQDIKQTKLNPINNKG